MAVRTFAMPTSLDQKLASNSSSSNSDGKSSVDSGQSLNSSLKEPLAYQQPKASPGITFAAQDKLAKLPIPDLESTCKKYLYALKCLQSHREHQNTIAAVQEFLKREGPELHERLKKYATGKTSYIEQFCKHGFLYLGREGSNEYL